MASGSSPHHNPDPESDSSFKSSDFAPDATHFESSVQITHDIEESRISQASMSTTATNVYAQLNESLCQEMISAVERTMKKNEDNLMRFLEGISSRLSQLELYCYNLDKSVGQMRSELDHDHGEADSKLKSLAKQIQEVHRSVQVLGDKQEIAKTQKELVKLHLAQKESLSVVGEERTVVSVANPDDMLGLPNTKLTLALPREVSQHPSHAIIQPQVVTSFPLPPSQNLIPMPSYYLPSTQLPTPVSQPQPTYVPSDAQYLPQGHQKSQTQVTQTPQTLQFSQVPQQWSQEVNQSYPSSQPLQVQSQNQVQAQTLQSSVYPSPPEPMAHTMPPMLVSFHGVPLQAVSHVGTLPQSQPLALHLKGGFPSQSSDGHTTVSSNPPMPSGGMYMVYGNEGGPPHVLMQPNHYSQGTCPTRNAHIIHSSSPPFVHNHSHNELIEKLISMGFRGDHVTGVIQMLEESGQSVNFNVVLDRLNGNPSGGSQRGWE